MLTFLPSATVFVGEITPAVWKVMFSQACLKNSVFGLGGVCPSMRWVGWCLPLGPRGVHPPGQTPPETATEADGTHPTGMLSCCVSMPCVPFQCVTLSQDKQTSKILE